MNNTNEIDIESKCMQALSQNNIQTFNHYYTKLYTKNSFIQAYKLLYLLGHNIKEYYFLFEQVECDDKYIKFVIDVERNMALGNFNRLKQLKQTYPQFSYLIDIISNQQNKEATKDEEIEDYVGDCMYILKKYNEI